MADIRVTITGQFGQILLDQTLNFTTPQPRVTGMAPLDVTAGTDVTITGEFLPPDTSVLLGTTPVQSIVAADGTSVKFKVPNLAV